MPVAGTGYTTLDKKASKFVSYCQMFTGNITYQHAAEIEVVVVVVVVTHLYSASRSAAKALLVP